jgi:phosphomethylpyrimidine synthase
VHEGVIAYKIAAHAGDVARGLPNARKIDDAMAQARAQFDWEKQFALSLDPERAKTRWLKTRNFTDEAHSDDHCSMCGKEFCTVRTSRRIKELVEKIK